MCFGSSFLHRCQTWWPTWWGRVRVCGSKWRVQDTPHINVRFIFKTFISSNVDFLFKKSPITLTFPFQPCSLRTLTRGINLYLKPVWPIIDILFMPSVLFSSALLTSCNNNFVKCQSICQIFSQMSVTFREMREKGPQLLAQHKNSKEMNKNKLICVVKWTSIRHLYSSYKGTVGPLNWRGKRIISNARLE